MLTIIKVWLNIILTILKYHVTKQRTTNEEKIGEINSLKGCAGVPPKILEKNV